MRLNLRSHTKPIHPTNHTPAHRGIRTCQILRREIGSSGSGNPHPDFALVCGENQAHLDQQSPSRLSSGLWGESSSSGSGNPHPYSAMVCWENLVHLDQAIPIQIELWSVDRIWFIWIRESPSRLSSGLWGESGSSGSRNLHPD